MTIRRADHPWLYAANVERHRLMHRAKHLVSRKLARERDVKPFPYKAMSHRSLLLRKLGNADMRLQVNKIQNLKLAAECINGIIIKPGETFSLWSLVGRPTVKRGFVPGMLLSQGEVIEGVGGGLCQMANLLYWMALHSPLTVTERYRHSYDVFPDSGRVLPFGSGATIFYNYVDLAFRNDTNETWQIMVSVGESHLEGEIRSLHPWPLSYKIVEKGHGFYRDDNEKWRRKNELYKRTFDKTTGNLLSEELVVQNDSMVLYDPAHAVASKQKPA
jgi:vancomycin resistance protein VanW